MVMHTEHVHCKFIAYLEETNLEVTTETFRLAVLGPSHRKYASAQSTFAYLSDFLSQHFFKTGFCGNFSSIIQ